jgi:hypothetical protein
VNLRFVYLHIYGYYSHFTLTFVDPMASGHIISPPCSSSDRQKYSPKGTHAFDPFVELMKFLQEFEQTVSTNMPNVPN